MHRALFVSLAETFPHLSLPAGEEHGSKALRDVTCCWWIVNPERARGVQYLFGVFESRVVCGYRVSVGVEQWPVMPAPAIAAGVAVCPSRRSRLRAG
jgi:hypothetical protein